MQNKDILELIQEYKTQTRFYGKSHSKIDFLFSHNARDFIVEEIPLYAFSNEGEHRILKIRKKNISTNQCLSLISKALKIEQKEIGYAGLKDKNALTYQYISIPNKYFKDNIQNFNNIENIKIIESHLHNNKIKIGHLKGNRFFIRLKKVSPYSFDRIKEEVFLTQKNGFPNFFGYQRFGNFGDNYIQALNIKKLPKKQTFLQKLLISSLQSILFNIWLEERLKISNIINSFNLKDSINAIKNTYNICINQEYMKLIKQSKLMFIPLMGDVCMHYPYGKLFYFGMQKGEQAKDCMLQDENILQHDIHRLKQTQISVTGLLSGANCIESTIQNNVKHKVWLAKDIALNIEKMFCFNIMAKGSRRYAWVYPNNVELEYLDKESQATLSFELPSGAYATTFLTYIKNHEL